MNLKAIGVNLGLVLLAAPALGQGSSHGSRLYWQELADRWQPEALEQLERGLELAAFQDVAFVAARVAERGGARGRVLERLAAGPQAIGTAAYSELLAQAGRALAEDPLTLATPRQRAELLGRLRAADPRIAAAAQRALAGLFARLRALGDWTRMESLAAALQREGLRHEPQLWAWRMVAALEGSAQNTPAETLAQAWLACEPRSVSAAQAAAAAACVRGEWTLARQRLAPAVAATPAERLELALARVALAAPGEERRARALELRRCVWSLRAQGLAAGWELLLDGDTGLIGMLSMAREREGWMRSDQLEWLSALARELGAVFPRTLPGFAGAESVPLEPGELVHLERMLEQQQLELQRENARLLDATLRELDPLGPPPEDELAWMDGVSTLTRLETELSQVRSGEPAAALERQWPSTLALTLAAEWWSEHQPERARALLDALEADLDRDPASFRWLWGVEFRAELERLRGSGRGDSGEPEAAEAELLRAIERLEALQRELLSRGAGERALAAVRSRCASVFVSLAVNANVRLRQPERALQYFEKAWALRQDDFMRGLRACYLARALRTAEARAMIALCPRSPSTLYNLACAHALLGERTVALDLLEADFEQNLPTRGMRSRQGEWAQDDPDLASLREEPRFRALLER